MWGFSFLFRKKVSVIKIFLEIFYQTISFLVFKQILDFRITIVCMNNNKIYPLQYYMKEKITQSDTNMYQIIWGYMVLKSF